MFFRKKESLEPVIHALEEEIHTLHQEVTASGKQLEHMNQISGQLPSVVSKHNMAIEDLLDEWADKRSGEELMQQTLTQLQQSEKQLLELLEAYQEHFFRLERYAKTNDPALASQLALMAQGTGHCRQLCGIRLIDTEGATVDYDLHEVIEVLPAPSPTQDKTVADIYRPGYLYKGTVKKKAQVAAYRLEKPDTPT